MDSATPPTLPPGDDAAGTAIPAQRIPPELLCAFCGRHERWTDTANAHHGGWRVCIRCIRAYRESNRRLADALLRMEPAS
jgi:hypothetical protein